MSGLTRSDASDRASRLALKRRPSEWQHLFGPDSSPVVVAGLSEPICRLVHALRALGKADGSKCVIVEGSDGCGKSLAAAAFQAACQKDGLATVLVNEGTERGSVMENLADADALIVDNLDTLSAGLRKALYECRHRTPSGTLLTTSRMSPVERQLVTGDDDHHPIGRWEERSADVLIIASLAWDDLGLSPSLLEICGNDGAKAFGHAPWSRGAHSIRRVVSLVAEALELEGYFERPPRRIGAADVLEAVVAVIREEAPPEEEDAIHIIVEGSTDVTYFETAARLAQEQWGVDLLAGFRVSPPGEDREGGAEKAVREMLLLDARGVPAVALFDDDEPGRSAAKSVREFSNQKVHVLPAEFDPLKNPNGSGKTEIEDLVALPLMERFYAENSEFQPEERTVRGELTRVVVAGTDKEAAADWIADHASFEDLQRIVYVVCMLRDSIGLPLPAACPPLAHWIKELS